MQCEKCNKNRATVHLTEIAEGERSELHLCESCAQKEGVVVKSQPQLGELLNALLASQKQAGADSTSADSMKCPQCGTTFKQFRDEYLLGCPGDYEVFGQALRSIITRSQAGASSHCGKVPSRGRAGARVQSELLSLRNRLEAAVKNEEYETAAQLRDRIRKIESRG